MWFFEKKFYKKYDFSKKSDNYVWKKTDTIVLLNNDRKTNDFKI